MSDEYPGILRFSKLIEERKREGTARSYTNSLLQLGVNAIGSKVMEEASEFVTAAHELEAPDASTDDERKANLVSEASDLLYHAMVMLAHYDLSLQDVDAELNRRLTK